MRISSRGRATTYTGRLVARSAVKTFGPGWSRWSGAGLAAIALAGSTLFAGTLKPEHARMRSMKTFATQVHRRVGNAPIYIAGGHDYELSFYYGRGGRRPGGFELRCD